MRSYLQGFLKKFVRRALWTSTVPENFGLNQNGRKVQTSGFSDRSHTICQVKCLKVDPLIKTYTLSKCFLYGVPLGSPQAVAILWKKSGIHCKWHNPASLRALVTELMGLIIACLPVFQIENRVCAMSSYSILV